MTGRLRALGLDVLAGVAALGLALMPPIVVLTHAEDGSPVDEWWADWSFVA